MGDAWEPGEWTLGRHYKWIGIVACLWVAFIAILFIAPTSPGGIPWNDDFTWLSVNYAPIAVLGTLLLVGGWWVLSANKWFKGPIAQGTEEELARIEAQYEHAARGAGRHRRRRIVSATGSEGAGSRRLPPRRRAARC